MKKLKRHNFISITIILLTFSFLLYNCGRKKRDDQREKIIETKEEKKSDTLHKFENIITARTLGLAYLEENRLGEAEAEFLKLITLAPDEAIGYANLGLVYLRMGKYQEAEEQLKKAIELDPDDPNIRLNLAKVYQFSNEGDKSIKELEKTIEIAPDHVQTLYSLAESYIGSSDKYSMLQWEKNMKKVVEAAPANIVPRLHLIEVLLRNEKTDEALRHLEEIQSQYPEFPKEALSYYNNALESLHAFDSKEALTNVLIFHNFLKLTNPYQSGVTELKGPRDSSVGVPIITINESARIYIPEGESILDAIRFTDATASAGLDIVPDTATISKGKQEFTTHIAVGDFDHDGDQDLYLGTWFPHESQYNHFLLKSNMGRFNDVSDKYGILHTGNESSAIFSDYNNDGYLDLYVVKEESNVLYNSESEGIFQDVTVEARVGDSGNGNMALFFDMDHEGDLDLFLAKSGTNQLLRNNSDGTFTELAEQAGIAGENVKSRDACFGDFDDDGDIDLFVVNEDAGNILYSNLREGKFKDITAESGLTSNGGNGAVTTGDYNNDGYPDIFVTGLKEGLYKLYKNKGNGIFEIDKRSESVFEILKNVIGYDASFFDFDNDGFLDLMIAGESIIQEGKGVFLFHNDGTGKFEDVSNLLPEDLVDGCQIALADYNNDGDPDIFIAGLHGGVRLLRNDGGNANHHLKIQLVGIRTGSGKNNYFGIGAKIEVRAGDLYQMKVVTEPNVHFGLADRSNADVVRILWTNGTSQNIFSPGSDQALIEEQQLKGSCPFLYTWNGDEYVFVKDIMWRSALGMPLGIMGGTTTYAFADASEEYLKIPGELLASKNGKYSIQVTGELWETIYFDEVQLIAVDHPDSVEVFVDERFSPPPYPEYRIHSVTEKRIPLSAKDGKGNDLLPFITKKDNK